MTTTAWAHLPNAKHIDAVLSDVRKRPEAWKRAYILAVAGKRCKHWDAAWDLAWATARNLTRVTERFRAWDGAWNAVRSATGRHANIHVAAWGLTSALIDWDSAADLLDCTPDVLRAMIDLAEPPVCHQAALLLPYAIVRFGA